MKQTTETLDQILSKKESQLANSPACDFSTPGAPWGRRTGAGVVQLREPSPWLADWHVERKVGKGSVGEPQGAWDLP